jgi:hypothetical protein
VKRFLTFWQIPKSLRQILSDQQGSARGSTPLILVKLHILVKKSMIDNP